VRGDCIDGNIETVPLRPPFYVLFTKADIPTRRAYYRNTAKLAVPVKALSTMHRGH
jgi:hypothetical protein